MSKISAKVIGCKERQKLSVSIFHRAGLSRKAPVLFIQFKRFFFTKTWVLLFIQFKRSSSFYKNLGPLLLKFFVFAIFSNGSVMS